MGHHFIIVMKLLFLLGSYCQYHHDDLVPPKAAAAICAAHAPTMFGCSLACYMHLCCIHQLAMGCAAVWADGPHADVHDVGHITVTKRPSIPLRISGWVTWPREWPKTYCSVSRVFLGSRTDAPHLRGPNPACLRPIPA